MTGHHAEFGRLIGMVHETITARTLEATPRGSAARAVFARLRERRGALAEPTATWPPACGVLDRAVANAVVSPHPCGEIARSIASLAPALHWRTRADATPEFARRHANAYLVGPGGLEARDDVMIGVSVVAPETTYPDHDHPPEEVYLVLSPGEWRQNDEPWVSPGPGGIVHNPPGIVHAMRAGREPLLAVWCLLPVGS